MTWVSNFFYLFENPSVALIFFFKVKKIVLFKSIAPTIDIGLLKLLFLIVFSLFIFNI
jgi:hypothetical protein